MAARGPKRCHAQARISSVGCCWNCWFKARASAGVSFSALACKLAFPTLCPEHARAEIAESLPILPLRQVAHQQPAQLRDELLRLHRFLVQPVQASAAFVATQINLVLV